MYCKRCGRELPGPECPDCGAATRPPADDPPPRSAGILLEPDERVVAELRQAYVSGFLLGARLGEEYLVLSDRRIYCGGTTLGRIPGARLGRATGQVVIPLEHVTSVHWLATRNVGLLVAAIVALLLGIVALAFHGSELASVLASSTLVVAALLLVMYWLSKRQYLMVCSASASPAMDCRTYGREALVGFIRQLGAALTAHRKERVGHGLGG